ncbi:endonuclease/exonuclease/phosphatase family protein [Carboxylicivirga sp. M1479]|uniref:endonuclease/exonuclease/phosphatase family protein n=1 Tax=Carboxylicivirga sp. M1479 TaxID=2594476 RepID=UPI00117753CA|nr:endonuclease/exonuclease/phosphatase family protein [Carboxylicivirga sp. M1479]TRX65698.1 endonuclease/exonuclease/phosphatase family protein [Carboxylicivirga sp. M1479]
MLRIYPLLFVSLLIWLFSACSIQNKPIDKSQTAVIGFYNVENLFDTINSVDVRDGEFTPEGAKEWNANRYQDKLEKIAQVIIGIGDSTGYSVPSVMGLCELENIGVINDLVAHPLLKEFNYQIVHQDSPDKRGIDVALLYRADAFVLHDFKALPLMIYDAEDGDRIFTRDQLLVSGQLMGEKIHFVVNHWPSRYGGEERSRPLRKDAAYLSRAIVDSLQQLDAKAPVMLMGDFNDDPQNVSINDVLRAVGISEMQASDLYNPYADMHEDGVGTLCYRGFWNMFDQIHFTQNMLSDGTSLQLQSAHIYNHAMLKVKEGNYAGYPFRTFVGNRYDGGYSDHFPVYAIIKKN